MQVIEPKYTLSELKDIHYGKDETKARDFFTNPVYRICKCIQWGGVIAWVMWMILLAKTIKIPPNIYDLLHTYVKLFVSSFLDNENVMIIIELIIYGIMASLPGIIFAEIANITYIIFEKQGKIYTSPLSNDEYARFLSLYTKANVLTGLIKSNPNNIYFYLEDDDEETVQVHIINSRLTEKKEFKFPGLVRQIFASDKVDFSVIDKELDILLGKVKVIELDIS